MRQFTQIILIMSCFVLNAQTSTQSPKPQEVKLGVGYENYRILDQNLSPLIYSSHNLQLNYNRSKLTRSENVFFWGLGFSIGDNQPKRFGQRTALIEDKTDLYGNYEEFEVSLNPILSFLSFQYHIGYLKSIGVANKGLYLGPSFSNSFVYTGIAANTLLLDVASINLKAVKYIQVTDNIRLHAEAELPVFAVVYKNLYNNDPSLPDIHPVKAFLKTGTKLNTWNNYQNLNLGAGGVIDMGKKWSLGFDYKFTWTHYSFPENMKSYSNTFSVNLVKIIS